MYMCLGPGSLLCIKKFKKGQARHLPMAIYPSLGRAEARQILEEQLTFNPHHQIPGES